MTEEVFKTLASIDGFSDLGPGSTEVKRLGGLTNRNYKIDCPRGSYVLRLAGEGTGDYIDRQAEFHNAAIASNAGVNAEILHFDVNTGTMICRYIENSVTLDIERLRDLETLKRTGKAFRQLHDCGKEFQGRFELFDQIDQYLKVIRDLGAELPEGYETVQLDAEQVRAALSAQSLPVKPCHCDPMVENCIDNGDKVFIIDFEYAGNNDPMWDLGDISVEGDFSAEQDEVFMTAYFGHKPTAYDVGRMVMYKAMCDLLWTLWGVVQHANNNPADDFWAYAVERLERCKKLMATEQFPQHLASVQRGPPTADRPPRTGVVKMIEVSQQDLDSKQYAVASINQYEMVFGEDFVSPGGRELAMELVGKLDLPPGSRVLDVGSGLGGSAFVMAEEYRLRVDGIDLSNNMVEMAQQKLHSRALGELVNLHQGNCLDLQAQGLYDGIYSRDVFLHINDKNRLFQVLAASLRPGGKLLFTDYCCGDKPWRSDFTEYVNQRGYCLHTVPAYVDMVRHGGFDEVVGHDITARFIVILEQDLSRILTLDISDSTRKELEHGWRTKISRAQSGDQRWGLFTAVKVA